MDCPRCQAENRQGRRFCASCGAPLPVACPECGFANEPNEGFCGGCGVPLARSDGRQPDRQSAPSSGDRRQVTVVFADLCGFTELASRLDAEELHALVGRFLATVDGIVEDHGGTVDKHIGDAVMALFGAPVAHGDDPWRAVRAAFHIHEAMAALGAELRRPLQAHIGVASGAVVAAGIGGDYTVVGESVNLAARLDELAAPGETLISDPVRRAVLGRADCEALGEVAVKGFDRPVRVWRLRGLSDGTPEAADRPFVGRRSELGQIAGVIEACDNAGFGQTILVRGEAGIGKTRLIEEFTRLAAVRGFACHRALVLDFGVGKGQDAVRALVRSLLSVAPGGGKEAREDAAERAIAEGLIEPDRRIFLNDLLDLAQPIELRAMYDAMDNVTRNRGKQDLLGALVRSASAQRSVLLTVEDVHWAEPVTLAYLAAAAAAVKDCATVLVMTTRIEGDPLDRPWRAAIGGCPLVTIDLGPLRRNEAIELAGAYFDANNRVAANCVDRAEGNPLFLEQLLRHAEESEDESVPASIQSLVLARMDRLAASDKQAVQAAAAIGQRFGLETLRYLIDDLDYRCAGLIDHHLVRPEGEAFLFVHALIQETVYSSLLRARRRELHLRAAEWFAGRDPVLRAQHLDRADDAAAPRAYFEAARAQATAYHYERARQLVERGRTLATDSADRFDLTCLLGDLLHDLGSIAPSIAAYREALDLAADETARCRALIGLAAGMRVSDEFDDAFQALDEAEVAATRHGLTAELARIHHLRGNLFFPLGRIEGCRVEHELALQYARQVGSPELEARALSGVADAEYARGRMRTAHDYFRRCVDLARRHGFGRIEVANRSMIGYSREYLNELPEALEDAQAAAEAARVVGHQRAELLGENLALMMFFEKGDVAGTKAHIERARALVRRLGAWRFEPHNLMWAARVAYHEARRADAIPALRQALDISRETGLAFYGARILSLLALVLEDPRARQEALAEGERLLEQGAVGHNHLWFYRDAMEVALEVADWDGAERYATALEDYTRPEPLPWADFFIARGRALAAHGRGQRDEATMNELRRLRDEAERVGLRIALPALDRALAAARGPR